MQFICNCILHLHVALTWLLAIGGRLGCSRELAGILASVPATRQSESCAARMSSIRYCCLLEAPLRPLQHKRLDGLLGFLSRWGRSACLDAGVGREERMHAVPLLALPELS